MARTSFLKVALQRLFSAFDGSLTELELRSLHLESLIGEQNALLGSVHSELTALRSDLSKGVDTLGQRVRVLEKKAAGQ